MLVNGAAPKVWTGVSPDKPWGCDVCEQAFLLVGVTAAGYSHAMPNQAAVLGKTITNGA